MKARVPIILFVAFVVLLICWELAAKQSARFSFLFGRPTEVGSEFWKMIQSGEFFSGLWITGAEAALGTLCGTFLGCVIGLSLWLSRQVAQAVRPVVFALGNVPVFAFAPIMIVWFGTDFGMKVALAAFSTFFVSFGLAYRGASTAGREALEVLTAMRVKRLDAFVKVVVPASLDSVFNAARLNVGFGLLGAFIGEFISSDRGLGFMIIRASGLYNIPRVFATCIGIIALAATFDLFAALLERKRSRIVQLISVPRCLW